MSQHSTAIRSAEVERPYIGTLTTDERKALMRRKFTEECRFHKEFGVDMIDLDAGAHAHIMRSEVIRILESKGVRVPQGNLEALHQHLSAKQKCYGFNDGVNQVSTLLYDTDTIFMEHYHDFVQGCLNRLFPYPFYFQAIPTVRIHCPEGENNHHYPRYHTDINYGHPPEEINLWIPLTEPQPPQQHGFRMMSLADSQHVLEEFDYDFGPFVEKAIGDAAFNQHLHSVSPQVSTPLGKIFAFDSRCIHTAEPMLSHTRVSIDIRILPLADFEASPVLYQGVGRRKIRYLPGEAYHPLLSTSL